MSCWTEIYYESFSLIEIANSLSFYKKNFFNNYTLISCVQSLIEIALHHWLIILKQFNDWLLILFCLQTALNNLTKYSFMNLSLNQIFFEFWMCEILNLIQINKSDVVELINVYSILTSSMKSSSKHVKLIIIDQYKSIYIDAKDIIVFITMQMKHYYNKSHLLCFFKADNMINLQLHHRYTLSDILNKKLEQQFVKSLQIIE